jgi:integrase/recombinase XerC
MPAPVVEAIRRYLKYRGTVAGPLFLTRGNRGKNRDGRLETRSVLRIVRELGQKVSLHIWCHGLRHSSITAALDVAAQAGISLHRVLAHSRHAAITTLMTYADEHDRVGTQRTLGDLVAKTLTVDTAPATTPGQP